MNIKTELKSLVIRGWNVLSPLSAITRKMSFLHLILKNGEELHYSVSLNDMDDLHIQPVLDFSEKTEDRMTQLKRLKDLFSNNEDLAWLLTEIGTVIFSTLKGHDFYLNYHYCVYESDLERIFNKKDFAGLAYSLGQAIEFPSQQKYLVTFSVNSTFLYPDDRETTSYLISSSMNAAYGNDLFKHIFNQVNPQMGLQWHETPEWEGFENKAMRIQIGIEKVTFIGAEVPDEPMQKIDKVVSYKHSLLSPKIEILRNDYA